MFNWFLKLLGIDEDKPVNTGNAYLNTNTQSASQDAVISTATSKKAEPEAKSEPETQTKPVSKTEAKPETKATPEPEPVAKPKTAPETKPVPEPEAKTDSLSLSDDYPELKANYIKVLQEAGFNSRTIVDKASDKALLDLKGIGKATLKILRS